jgi:hypothetical protein
MTKYSSMFVWIKDRFHLKILIYTLQKEWSYNCDKVKDNKVTHAQWFKINRQDKKLEIKTYWDPPSSSTNTVTLSHVNKWGPYTNEETRIKKIDFIL